jgi:hypothetical protein
MAKRESNTDRARQLLQKPMSFDDFRSKLSARDGGNVDRHLAAIEQEPEQAHRDLWKRLVSTLATLAPHAATTTGQQVVSFFIADGKYRMQTFALEDQRDGKLIIYSVDALKEAINIKLLRPPTKDVAESSLHQIDGRQTLSVEALTAQNTPNPPSYYKHMLGWNRTAVRITLPVHASPEQVAAAESLCALAALTWTKSKSDNGGSGRGDEPLNPQLLLSR